MSDVDAIAKQLIPCTCGGFGENQRRHMTDCPRHSIAWEDIASALAEAEKRGRDAVAGMVYETPPGEFSPDGWTWKQAFAAEKVRRIEAEAEIETLHQKYAQERMSRSRQTISDNTKMENQ